MREPSAAGGRPLGGDVRAFYAALGVELPGWAGPNVAVRCFANGGEHAHGDRNASCSVSVEHGAWCCHACGARGGAYDAALARGLDPARAMELLRGHGLVADDDRPRGASWRRLPADRNGSARACDRTDTTAVGRGSVGSVAVSPPRFAEADTGSYARALAANAAALSRLRELRGWSPEAVCALGLGLDGDRVVFPVRDASGALVGLLRYQPDPAQRNGSSKMLARERSLVRAQPRPSRNCLQSDGFSEDMEGRRTTDGSASLRFTTRWTAR